MEHNADEAFARLEQLLDELPKMEALGVALFRAKAARQVLDAKHEFDVQSAQLDMMSRLADAENDASLADLASGNAEAAADHHRAMLYYADQAGLHKGPVASAKRTLEKALGDGGFSTVEEAEASSMAQGELDALASRIETYQADYQHTLQLCRKFELDD